MKHTLFAAIMAVTGLGLGMTSITVQAADLNYDESYSDYSSSSSSPYDDPRYARIYGRTERDVLPRERSYRSSRTKRTYSYSSSGTSRCDRPNHDAHGHSSSGNYSRTCLSKYQIRRNLRDLGWRDFRLIRARRNVAVIKARQLDGDLYKIRVDRCSGEVLRARILNSYRGDDYAYSRSRSSRSSRRYTSY